MPDLRTGGQRYAAGFYRLCQLATPNLPDVRGERPNVHHDGWSIEMIGGMPWFVPPPWIDADRTPRQHSRYKVTQLRT